MPISIFHCSRVGRFSLILNSRYTQYSAKGFRALASTTSISTKPKMATTDKLTTLGRNLKVGPLKKLYKYLTPGVISLAGGLPMDSKFPFKKIDVYLEDEDEASYSLVNSQNLLMNYTRGDGITPLKNWIHSHIQSLHNPREGVISCVTVGSSDAWAKTVELIDTDAVIYDTFAYGTAVNVSEVLGKRSIGIANDEFGMIPEALRSAVLQARAEGLKVNLVYLVPIGQNPTGLTMTEQRKAEIYAVCQELDLIIAEDDAYYYLYYDLQIEGTQGLHNLPKSFLSMDTDGRVIRLDSLSKLIAPGMRIGFVSGPAEFIEKFMLWQEGTSQFPSGLSQAVFYGLVQKWDSEGLHNFTKNIQQHYKDQCEVLTSAIREHFPDGTVEYTLPKGGMFIWLTFPQVKLAPFALFEEVASVGVVCVPGDSFWVKSIDASQEYTGPPCLRLSFASSGPDQIRKAIELMAAKVASLSSSSAKD